MLFLYQHLQVLEEYFVLGINNGIVIQWLKSTAIGWRTVSLPITFPFGFCTPIAVLIDDDVTVQSVEVSAFNSAAVAFGVSTSAYILTVSCVCIGY